MSNITSQHVEIKVDDGTTMLAWLAQPANEKPRRAIMVFPEIFGVNAHIRDVTNRFATLGFSALSPELFHRTAPPKWECSYTDFPSARGHMQATQETTMESDVKATYNWLKANTQAGDNIACVGYCMGGRTSVIVAGKLPDRVAAAGSFHGGGLVTDDANSPHLLADRMKATVYVAGAENDASFTAEQAETLDKALTAANVTHTVEFYPAAHGFAVPDNAPYDEAAAERHWIALQELFASALPD